MIVVVGSSQDETAREIVAKWAAHDAALLTCEDLSAAGWRHHLFNGLGSTAVVSGQIVPEHDIRGVLVRRPWICEQELVHIAAADREYVAAEMNAFLVSWLSHLRCRVLNRPGGTCLCGPNWRPQQWVRAAAMVGMNVKSLHWRVPAAKGRRSGAAEIGKWQPVRLMVLGDRCLGAHDESTACAALRLASIAGTDLLSVQLAGGEATPHFLKANPMPSLKDADVAKAVCEHLLLTDRRFEPI